jgi:rod shape-determining protein MreD
MHWVRFLILLLAVTLLQASAIHVLALAEGTVYPHLLLMLLVFAALNLESKDAIIACFVTGLAADFIGTSLGPHMIAYGIVGSALHELRRFIAVDTWIYQALAIGLTGFLCAIVAQYLIEIKGLPAFTPRRTLLLWIPFYSSLVGPLLFLVWHPILGIKKRRTHLGLSAK